MVEKRPKFYWREVLAFLLAVWFIGLCWLVATSDKAEGLTVQERCDFSRGTVEKSGAVLPEGFEFRCTNNQYPHWGVTSGPPNSPPHFVSINVGRIGGDDKKLRYVLAHEICHARASVGQEPGPWTDEEAADACAKKYGFPNTYFQRTDAGPPTLVVTVITSLALLIAVAALVVALRRRKRRNGK